MCVPVWPVRLADGAAAADAVIVVAGMAIAHYSQWQHLLPTNASAYAPICAAVFVHYDNHNPNR